MRVIKFRAWEISGSGFIAGFNMVNYHGYYNKGLTPNIYRYDTNWEEGEYILEQFTGLHDKNGKEIYEGDILRWSVNDVAPVGHVYFDCGSFDMHKKINTDDIGLICWDPLRGESEIIGNIHGNPELLEK